jgi:hypothetical protein
VDFAYLRVFVGIDEDAGRGHYAPNLAIETHPIVGG